MTTITVYDEDAKILERIAANIGTTSVAAVISHLLDEADIEDIVEEED